LTALGAATSNHTHSEYVSLTANLVAIGENAIASGIRTVAIGINVTASGNLATSIGCLSSALGIQSIAIGSNALANLDSAIAIGPHSSAMGKTSVAIGAGACSNSGSAISIGQNASGDGVSIGYYASTVDGSQSIAIGYSAKANNTRAVAIGYSANASAINSTAIGQYAICSVVNGMQLGNATSLASLSAKVSLTVTSDSRDKADFEKVDNGLKFINKLNPVTYVFNGRDLYNEELSEEELEIRNKYGIYKYDKDNHDKGTKKGKRRRAGLEAQKVIEALKDVYGDSDYANIVNDNLHDENGDLPDGVENRYSMSYETLVPFLISAVQELSNQVEDLKEQLNG